MSMGAAEDAEAAGPWWVAYLIKASIIIAVIALQMRGMAVAERVEMGLAVCVILPFVLLLFVAIGQGQVDAGALLLLSCYHKHEESRLAVTACVLVYLVCGCCLT